MEGSYIAMLDEETRLIKFLLRKLSEAIEIDNCLTTRVSHYSSDEVVNSVIKWVKPYNYKVEVDKETNELIVSYIEDLKTEG